MKTAMDIPDKEGQKRLVIVGGGFGGLKLARKLKSNKFQIVLLDKNNHHIFQPLLFLPRFSGSGPAVQVATVSSGMDLIVFNSKKGCETFIIRVRNAV